MATDVQLSRDFWLHEAPCWELATDEDVAVLQEISARILQPVRNQWGPVWITSFKWWRSGCEPRTGAHAHGAVDFVTPQANLRDVFDWGNTYLMPTGYIGRWIYEPRKVDAEGNTVQGEHIHVATREAMLALNGDGRIMALLEEEDGYYVYGMWGEDGWGTFTNPVQLPGISVELASGSWLLGLGLLGALLFGPKLQRA